MKFLRYFIIIFISFTTSIKADLDKNLISQLMEGGKLIFIRHAYAPGSGDPENFSIKNCLTQRNLNQKGRDQSAMIGVSFKRYNIPIENIISTKYHLRICSVGINTTPSNLYPRACPSMCGIFMFVTYTIHRYQRQSMCSHLWKIMTIIKKMNLYVRDIYYS